MPVKDLAPYVGASVESVLVQTFDDFEFVILDDGSTDATREILQGWAKRDRRIRLFCRDRSLGPAGSSNWVVAQASGVLIARMDGDDLNHPERLFRQVEALDRHPEACLVGTLWAGIDEKGRPVRPRDRSRLAKASPFAPFPHGSVMFRREAFDRVGGYRAEANFWEDLDLYRRLTPVGKLIVLPKALYYHRASSLSTRLVSPPELVESAVDRMYRQIGGDGDACRAGAGKKILPRVFLSLGSTRIWAGRSPKILSRLLQRGALRWNGESVAVLAWAVWGSVSPRSLRFCLKWAVSLRDFFARRRIPEDRVYTWAGPPDAETALRSPAESPPVAEDKEAQMFTGPPQVAALSRQA